ncbi:alpha/beta hydrolase [Rubrivivax sp. RP6-9]|uniref:alpha/beta hydrolase n=1 Tax=Rubrivivax sp. RP6-9 TaxID=3415750 RepID=UPI003CC60D4B
MRWIPLLWLAALPAWAAEPPAGLAPCRLAGIEHAAWCGSVQRPLDPAQPAGRQIDVHFAVLPAVARNKKPDPVFLFAGGPGQSAIDLAGSASRLLARLSNRRDIVLVDQRGTGRSAPLHCADDAPARPLREQVDPALQRAELQRCRAALQALPHGDLRQYTTRIAVQDIDAVRQRLGVARFNAVGGSYGTRAVLETMRQFPQTVRRAVLDGVAPPDMVLPASFSPDAQATFDALLAACEAEPACRQRHPALRARWQSLLDSLPREVSVQHPVTRQPERFVLTPAMAASLVRAPLYVPALAAALPLAVDEAAQGRFTALFGLASAFGGGVRLAAGMHFSVVCAEDLPRLDATADRPGADFGTAMADLYRDVCAGWPRGEVPASFYTVPPATGATLLLSGGLDPATPPRHGTRVAQALGPLARHAVVPNAGHGVMGLLCVRDALFRFIDAETDADALAVDADCAQQVPRPGAFLPPAAGGTP